MGDTEISGLFPLRPRPTEEETAELSYNVKFKDNKPHTWEWMSDFCIKGCWDSFVEEVENGLIEKVSLEEAKQLVDEQQ